MRKPKDKHGKDLKVGDNLYAHGFTKKPIAEIVEIDLVDKIVYISMDISFEDIRSVKRTPISFKSIGNSHWRRWDRNDKSASHAVNLQ